MKLNQIFERLQNFPEQIIQYYSENGELKHKTFMTLYRDSDQLIQSLKKSIQPGMKIGILAENSYDWLKWDIVCLQLQCSLTTFTGNEKQSLTELIEKYQLHLLVTDRTIKNITNNIINIKKNIHPELNIIKYPLQNESHSFVFSSGTTGKQKGLKISKQGTEHLVELYHKAFEFRTTDNHLLFLPFSGYQQRMVYYGCLYYGSGISIVPFLRVFFILKSLHITSIIAPPIFYENLYKMSHRENSSESLSVIEKIIGKQIRILITGMAPIRRKVLDYFKTLHLPLYEAYGITEAGMVAWNTPNKNKIGTLGQLAEKNTIKLDEIDNEVIVYRDKPLSLGYFDVSENDQKTTFKEDGGVATGDIAEFDQDKFLRIIGRKKDIIITRSGEKFHPETIEQRIYEQPDIEAVAIIAGEQLQGNHALVYYGHQNESTENNIKQHIQNINNALPDYQHIHKIYFLAETFSLENQLRTANLKLNRQAIYQYYLQQQTL